jgi:hypothetical protein
MLAADTGPVIGIAAGAVVAALGYVGKLGIESLREWRKDRAERLARLLQLQALLRAGRTAALVQRDLAGRLAAQLRAKHPNDLPQAPGLERLFSALYERFDPQERELHSVIRAYTEHALRPINRAIEDWLRTDTQHRTLTGKGAAEARLAHLLNKLDAHLILWLAKYEGWIPNRPEHALVYLADEEQHGLGFPPGLDGALAAVLGERTSPSASSESPPEDLPARRS